MTGEGPTAGTGLVRLRTRDGVTTVELDRPDQGNSINLELARELRAAVAAIDRDAAARSILLAARGGFFCAGGDLRSFSEADDLPRRLCEVTEELHPAISGLAQAPVPVVAAVTGAVAGAGLGLMMCADLVVAGESSSFTTAYTAVGLCPDGGTSWLLPRRLGEARALELLLTNRRLSASEALGMGLVTEVVDDAVVRDRADELARRLAAGSTPALGAARRLVRSAAGRTLDEQLRDEAAGLVECAAGPDPREGIAAFLAKRVPRFNSSNDPTRS